LLLYKIVVEILELNQYSLPLIKGTKYELPHCNYSHFHIRHLLTRLWNLDNFALFQNELEEKSETVIGIQKLKCVWLIYSQVF